MALCFHLCFGLAAQAQEQQGDMSKHFPDTASPMACVGKMATDGLEWAAWGMRDVNYNSLLLLGLRPGHGVDARWRSFPDRLFQNPGAMENTASALGRQHPSGNYHPSGYPGARDPETAFGAALRNREWPKPARGWFCRMEDGIARRLPWAIDFGTD